MTTWQFIVLSALGLLGAGGTWFRAYVAYREHRAAERQRRRFEEGQ